jgi:hypothetical protein
MALDTTSFASGLKQIYVNNAEVMKNLVYADHPFLGMVAKMEKFYGLNLPLPLVYGNPQGRSASISTAITNKTDAKVTAFTLTRAKDYAVASIDNETLEASENDAGAFMEAATVQIDGAFQSASRSLAGALFRDGSGAIGRINATVAGTTLTLATTVDIVNFEVGMKIQFSSAATSATLRDSGKTLTISTINRDAGSMVVSANLNTISGLTSQDYINVQGDIESKVKGLEAWLPASVSATSFFGVDRTTDSYRLGGVKYDGSSQPIEEALIDGASRAAREGGKIDTMFLNYANFANLEKALGSKVQYVDVPAGGNLGFGYRGILVNGPRGPIKVVPDQDCPALVAYGLQMNTWKLYSLKTAPRLLEQDGLKMLRESTADSVEVRVGYYAQLGCVAPGWNVRITLAS